MLMSTLEAEDNGDVGESSTLHRPLLSDDFLEGDGDGDEELVSQLISTSERSHTRHRQLHRVRRMAYSFMVLSLMGLFVSGWSTFFACDLVAVKYPKGGVHLLVKAFGVWSYQQEVIKKNHNGSSNGINKHVTTKSCLDYDAIQKNHQDVDLKDFFPVNKTTQAYSIVSVSFYIAAMLAIFIFLVIVLAHPEVFTGSESVHYPATGMTGSVIAAACFFVGAGVFYSLLIHGLLHFSEGAGSNSQSLSICSPTHSHCRLGRGGYWVVFTICTSFVCGLVASIAAYNIRRIRAGKGSFLLRING